MTFIIMKNGYRKKKVTCFKLPFPNMVDKLISDHKLKEDESISVLETHYTNHYYNRGYRTPFKYIFSGKVKDLDPIIKKLWGEMQNRKKKHNSV